MSDALPIDDVLPDLIAALTRHLLATIGGGMLVFFLLRWWLGQMPI